MIDKCPYCGSTEIIYDSERGEYICTNCGTVLQEHVVDLTGGRKAYDEEERRRRLTATPTIGLGSKYSLREMRLLSYGLSRRKMTIRELAYKHYEKAVREVLYFLKSCMNIDVDMSEIPKTLLTICEEAEAEYGDRGYRICKASILMYFRYVKNIQLTGTNMKYVEKNLRLDPQDLVEGKKLLLKYMGNDIMIEPALEKAIKYIDERFRPLVRKIVKRLISDSNIVRTMHRSIPCLAIMLVIMLAERLNIGDPYAIREIALREGICSRGFIRNLKKLNECVEIEIYLTDSSPPIRV